MSWEFLGESVPGTSHRDRTIDCQDAFRARTFGPADEWLVVAVADGAGSAAHSEVGAALACDELVKRVHAVAADFAFSREWAVELFGAVRNEIMAEAERRGVRPRELACTALLAVVGPHSTALAQLGDGAIVIGDGANLRTPIWPEPGEYVNVTDFLIDERFADAIQFMTTAEQITEFAVLTDGLQRLALDFAARTPHPPFFRPLFRRLWEADDLDGLVVPFRQFLDSPMVNSRTDDDKTLVLAVRRP